MKIIAIGIANLTDARYFAAMGVDWIGFSMGANRPLSVEHIIAFADWVEGPRFFLDVRGKPDVRIAEILGDFEAAGLLIDHGTTLPHYGGKVIRALEQVSTNHDTTDILIYSFDQWQASIAGANNSHNAEEVWVNVQDTAEYLDLTGASDTISGIIISGGAEQKIGVKSYDELDELIERIRS